MDKKPLLTIKSLKEQVYEYLREQMRSGALKPASAIDMEETSRRLGVSKTPLRDALLQLEMEGFVSILPRRRVVVKPLTLEDIKDSYEVIGALEGTALLLAADRLGGPELDRLQKLNDAMARAIAGDDFDLYYDRNLAFHDVFLGLCGNAHLVRIVDTLKKRLYDFPRQEGFVKEWETASIGEHQQLVDLLRKGRPKDAADHLRDVHWCYAIQRRFVERYYANAAKLLG